MSVWQERPSVCPKIFVTKVEKWGHLCPMDIFLVYSDIHNQLFSLFYIFICRIYFREIITSFHLSGFHMKPS